MELIKNIEEIKNKAKEQGFDTLRIFENGVIWGYSYMPHSSQFCSQPGRWDEDRNKFIRDYNSLCCTEDCNIAEVIYLEKET